MKRIIAIGALALLCLGASAKPKTVTIGVVADIQYDRDLPDNKGRHYKLGPQRTAEAVATFKQFKDLQFVANLGDMTNSNYPHYVDVKKAFGDMTVYSVFGNHDFRPAKTEAEFREAAKIKGLEKPYYSVIKGGVRFIFLNCSDIALHSAPADSPKGILAQQWFDDLKAADNPAAKEYNGGLGFEQLKWLDDQLCKADRSGQVAIVMCHMLLLPIVGREALWNNVEVVHMLEAHPSVKAVFCGHRHPGSYEVRNGIHYVNFLGMVEGDQNRYAVVKITPGENIVIDGFGDEPDRVLEMR